MADRVKLDFITFDKSNLVLLLNQVTCTVLIIAITILYWDLSARDIYGSYILAHRNKKLFYTN